MIDLEQYRPQLEAVEQTDGIVVGSIGRMAVFSEHLNNPYVEFVERRDGHLNMPEGRVSDLDVLGLTEKQAVAVQAINPEIFVDRAFMHEAVVSRGAEGAWYVRANGMNMRYKIAPGLMERRTVVVDGVVIPTVSLAAHSFLHSLMPKSPKDALAMSLLSDATIHPEDAPSRVQQEIAADVYGKVAAQRLFNRSQGNQRPSTRDSEQITVF